jgi:hypothetical protein
MSEYASYNICVALLPTPFVLLYLPRIDDITDKVESIAGIMLEKVVELFRFAVFGT